MLADAHMKSGDVQYIHVSGYGCGAMYIVVVGGVLVGRCGRLGGRWYAQHFRRRRWGKTAPADTRAACGRWLAKRHATEPTQLPALPGEEIK